MLLLLIKILISVVPALVPVMIALRKFRCHIPLRSLASAFGLGALVVIVVTILVLVVLPSIPNDSYVGALLKSIIDAAVPEEGFKFLALLLLAIRSRYFKEMPDAIVYAVCVGMGFTALENVIFVLGNADWIFAAILRATVSVAAHCFFAIIMGTFFALGWFNSPGRRRNLSIALFLPIGIHALYDTCCYAIGGGFAFSGILLVAFLILSYFILRYTRKRIAVCRERCVDLL